MHILQLPTGGDELPGPNARRPPTSRPRHPLVAKAKLVLLGILGFIYACALLFDHTGLPLHFSIFAAHLVLLWKLNQYLQKKVLAVMERKEISVSPTLDPFLAHALLFTSWTCIRHLFYPEPGHGGSYLTAVVTVLVIESLVQTVLSLISTEVKTAMLCREALVLLCLIIYLGTTIIISDWVLGAMASINPWTHIFISAVVLGFTFHRCSAKKVTFPLVLMLAMLPATGVVLTSLVVAGTITTNPSWALVDKNTKLELIQKLGTSDEFILNGKEICNEADAMAIPSESYPVILKPNICTTANKGVRPCQNVSEVIDYLRTTNKQGTIHRGGCYALSQRMVLSKKEFVIFYMRYPYMKHGFIKALGERGKRREVIHDDAVGKHYGKAFFGDYFFSKLRNDLVTPQLMEYLDKLSHNFPGGWNSGRLDVKVMDDANIAQVKDLGILEINLNAIGDISEKDLYDWNQDEPTLKPLHTGILGLLKPFRQIRTVVVQFYMGWYNLLSGNISPSLLLYRLPFVLGRAEVCWQYGQYVEHFWGRE